MGAATLPKALRAVVAILLVDRLPQHRHRSVDDLVLERGLPDRPLAPVFLLAPDPLYGGCLGASMTQTLMHVPQMLVEVGGRLLGCHPIDPCGARLPRLALRLLQKVLVDQVRQRREDPIGIAGGRRRTPLELRCDGW